MAQLYMFCHRCMQWDFNCVMQGFHWFAHEEALAEIHRILRPGRGGLCLIWNREDGTNPWARDLLSIFEPLSKGIPQYWTGEWVSAVMALMYAMYHGCPGCDCQLCMLACRCAFGRVSGQDSTSRYLPRTHARRANTSSEHTSLSTCAMQFVQRMEDISNACACLVHAQHGIDAENVILQEQPGNDAGAPLAACTVQELCGRAAAGADTTRKGAV